MNTATASLLARKQAERRAAGLMVIVTFDGREPFDYCARDIAARDNFIEQMTAKIGQPDPTGSGHVVRTVEIAA
jgi:uncharacterized protein YegJ (DUF2314 family)